MSTYNFFNTVLRTILVLYLADDLHLKPAAIGLILAALGPGSLMGVLLTSKAATRFGLGRTIAGGVTLAGIGNLAIPLAGTHPGIAVPVLTAAMFVNGFGQPFYTINQVSLRQAITPTGIQGRMNATNQFVVSGPGPLAALLGGLLGELLGLRLTLLVGAVGTLLAIPWLMLSPIGSLRAQPEPVRAAQE